MFAKKDLLPAAILSFISSSIKLSAFIIPTFNQLGKYCVRQLKGGESARQIIISDSHFCVAHKTANTNCYRVQQETQLRKLLRRGADKSLARPGRKQANVSVRMA